MDQTTLVVLLCKTALELGKVCLRKINNLHLRHPPGYATVADILAIEDKAVMWFIQQLFLSLGHLGLLFKLSIRPTTSDMALHAAHVGVNMLVTLIK